MAIQNIFITGASSKIGRFLIKSLLDKEYNMVLLCRKEISEFSDPKIRFILGDLLDSDSYASSLDGIDTVLHMAAVTHTNEISKYYEVNSDATLELIKACKAHGVKRFIFISTRAISEEGGHYSKSKLIAERHVQESGLDWVIMRLAEVYGISGRNGIDMILGNIHRLPFIPILGDGEYKIAPVYISDVIYPIVRAIEKRDKNNRVYNIAGPESFTYNQFIDKILQLKHIKRIKVHIPLWAFWMVARISGSVLNDGFLVMDQLPRLLCKKSENISLAVTELGFKPARLGDVINIG